MQLVTQVQINRSLTNVEDNSTIARRFLALAHEDTFLVQRIGELSKPDVLVRGGSKGCKTDSSLLSLVESRNPIVTMDRWIGLAS